MTKRMLSLLLIVAMLLSLVTTAFAATTTTQDQKATALKDLGIISGIPTFDLTKSITKTEATVMYLRLLGKDSEAKKSTYKNPFKDVPVWATKYISYAYTKGLASGTTKTTFGSNSTVTPEQFLTFMLKALGYNDKAGGDFTAKTVIQKAEKLCIIPAAKYKTGSKSLTRGNCVDIIYSVLSAIKKDSKATLAKSLVDSKAIDLKIAEKYGFYTPAPASTPTPTPTPAPTYQMVRVSLEKQSDGFIAIWARDVIAAIPGAKYVCCNWDDTVSLTDYKSAFSIDDYPTLINPSKPADVLDYLTNNGGQYVNAKEAKPTSRLMVSAYDEKANMIAAAISTSKDAVANGYLEFALVTIDGAKFMATFNSDFEKAFGNPVECTDAIINIEKAQVKFTFISRKTGKVVSTGLANTNGVPDTYYRYVIDSTKYPELATNTKYLGEYSLSTGMTAIDSLKQVSLNWFKSSNYNGTLGGNQLVADFSMGDNGWTKKASEWNNTRCVSFADANKKLIGCTSFVPSQLKVVDVGTVDQTAYVN